MFRRLVSNGSFDSTDELPDFDEEEIKQEDKPSDDQEGEAKKGSYAAIHASGA